MLPERLRPVIEGLNGIVMIDIDDAIPGCWNNNYRAYWVLKELSEVASSSGIHLFIDKGRGLLEDNQAISKDELTADWTHIPRGDYQRAATTIEKKVGILREQTTLGFAGTYAESCVRKFLWALCEERIIPNVPIDCPIIPLTEKPIPRQFKRGKLLYELTDNRYASLFLDSTMTF